MIKPQPKNIVVIKYSFNPGRLIVFAATPEGLAVAQQFGSVDPFDSQTYALMVSPLYDCYEVLEYLQNQEETWSG